MHQRLGRRGSVRLPVSAPRPRRTQENSSHCRALLTHSAADARQPPRHLATSQLRPTHRQEHNLCRFGGSHVANSRPLAHRLHPKCAQREVMCLGMAQCRLSPTLCRPLKMRHLRQAGGRGREKVVGKSRKSHEPGPSDGSHTMERPTPQMTYEHGVKQNRPARGGHGDWGGTGFACFPPIVVVSGLSAGPGACGGVRVSDVLDGPGQVATRARCKMEVDSRWTARHPTVA